MPLGFPADPLPATGHFGADLRTPRLYTESAVRCGERESAPGRGWERVGRWDRFAAVGVDRYTVPGPWQLFCEPDGDTDQPISERPSSQAMLEFDLLTSVHPPGDVATYKYMRGTCGIVGWGAARRT